PDQPHLGADARWHLEARAAHLGGVQAARAAPAPPVDLDRLPQLRARHHQPRSSHHACHGPGPRKKALELLRIAPLAPPARGLTCPTPRGQIHCRIGSALCSWIATRWAKRPAMSTNSRASLESGAVTTIGSPASPPTRTAGSSGTRPSTGKPYFFAKRSAP